MNSSPDKKRWLSYVQLALIAALSVRLGTLLVTTSETASLVLVAAAVVLTFVNIKGTLIDGSGSATQSNAATPLTTKAEASSAQLETAQNGEAAQAPRTSLPSENSSVSGAIGSGASGAIDSDFSAVTRPGFSSTTQPGSSRDQDPAAPIPASTPLTPTAGTDVSGVPAPMAQAAAQDSSAIQPGYSILDFAQLSETLLASEDPISTLKHFVRRIRSRERQSAEQPPCALELYAARMLEEAGLFSTDVELPSITVVRPQASRMVYLRSNEASIPYLAYLRIVRIEAALNALRFASASLPPDASMEEAYRLNQGLARSIVAQAPTMDAPFDPSDGGTWPDGEWTVRYGISHAIESAQLPYRLVARYRTNVADGNVGIEFDLTPAEAFPTSCYLDGLGIVPTTGDMRQRAAADYALRLALLLAARSFRCSERIKHVWVAATQSTATRRSCYLSVDFDRWRFARLDPEDLGELSEVYRSFAPVMRYEDGWLRPVQQGFHLEEERFCPSRRYLPVSLSSRRLKGHVAQSLGCDHVSGLAIEEADGRALMATAIMMHLDGTDDAHATQKSVRTIMELAGDDPDPSVRSAAERVVRSLVAGTLEPDALVVGEEFVRGDALTRANDRAKELLLNQQPLEAAARLEPLLARIDAGGTYADSATIAYRYFGSYAERALYNRLTGSDEAKSVLLVPNAYFEAHLIVSICQLAMGRFDEAIVHARRLVELAPLDAHAQLHLVKCLEVLERDDEAVDRLNELLEHAFEPYGVGLAYYRMAYFQWKRGNLSAAQACYQNAMRHLPGALPMMAMELSVFYLQNPEAVQEQLSDQQLRDALATQGIPVAPTPQTSEAFYDCTRASLDAEVFPVARNFVHILAAFSGDDILAGVARSLEDEPDR